MTIAVMLSWYKHVTTKRLSSGLREGASFQELRKEPGVALATRRIMRMVDFGDIVPLEPEVEKEIAAKQSLGPEQATSGATRTTESGREPTTAAGETPEATKATEPAA